jgi:regulator of sigma E protease
VDLCITSAAADLSSAVTSFVPQLAGWWTLLAVTATEEPSTLQWLQGMAQNILTIGLGLGFVIFVHELGHFLVAKACGVKCDKFYIGFDIPMPKILGWQIPSKLVHFQWGETEYGVGILPLGGYVKMLGQDDDPRNAEAEAQRTKVLKEGTAAEGLTPGQSVEQGYVLDPRSFPAKSVPARMAIISAGVIMNLIFAVILAAIAYHLGVPEVPAVIGTTSPGGPAWTKGIEPGSKIIQLGRSGEPYEHLRFDDLRYAVVVTGFNRDLPLQVRTPAGQPVWFELRPSDRLKPLVNQPTLGVGQQMTRKIEVSAKSKLAWRQPATSIPLEDGDLIVAVDGQPVEADSQLAEILAARPTGEITLTIERTEKPALDQVAEKSASEKSAPAAKRLDVVVQPLPMRELGVTMKMGPIVAVRAGSPAEDAGFKVDDVIVKVNGEPAGDPLSLGQRLAPRSVPADPLSITVSRQGKNGKPTEVTLEVSRVMAQQFHNAYLAGGPAAIESIGVAFDILPVVAELSGPAVESGLQPGDVITQAEFVPSSDETRKAESAVFHPKATPFEPIEIDAQVKTWTSIATRLQAAHPETKVKLTFVRGKETKTALLTSQLSDTFFDEARGVNLYGLSEIRVAENWSSAFSLGFRETRERLKEVLGVLTSLFSGNLSPTNISGPMGIFQAASMFASEGIPKMLIFLTLLSANLAVLNFLPIPALDGGHMLFLTAEWIRGKPVDEQLQVRLTVAGVLCLLSLMVFATAMDIGRFLG